MISWFFIYFTQDKLKLHFSTVDQMICFLLTAMDIKA